MSRVFYLPQHRTLSTRHPLVLWRMQLTGCWVSADERRYWKFLGSPPRVWTPAFSAAGEHSTTRPLSHLKHHNTFIKWPKKVFSLVFEIKHLFLVWIHLPLQWSDLIKNPSPVISAFAGLKRIYIGLSDTVGDNKLSSYKWLVDGSTVKFTNFRSNEPNSAHERCVVFRQDEGYKWTDNLCDESHSALCESNPVGKVLWYNAAFFVYEWSLLSFKW